MKQALRLIGKLLLNIFLFILAGFLLVVFFLLGVGYSIYESFWKRKVGNGLKILSDYFFISAASIDRTGNAVLGPLWTDLFCKSDVKRELRFGDLNKTISEQLGDNKFFNNLTGFGIFMCKFLHLLDKFHVEKASDYYPEYK